MQVTIKLASLVALATMAIASPAVVADTKVSVVTDAEFDNWLRTTDANLTFIGSAKESLASRNALDTTMVYCNRRVANLCGGDCNVYQGGSICLNVPVTACIMATSNVAFCTQSNCGGGCRAIGGCQTRLESGFCATPGTVSILVPQN